MSRRRTAAGGRRDDRGEAAISMAIIFPLIIVLTVAIIQAASWYNARQVALTAAREGVTVGRGYQAGPGQGAAAARAMLGRMPGNLQGASVATTGSTPARIRIQVSGTVPSLVPGMADLRVTQSASGAVERWTQAQ